MDVKAIAAVLQNARSPVDGVRKPAVETLNKLAESNAATYFAGMATALAEESLGAELRQLAGLMMRTGLDAVSEVLREARATRWLNIAPGVRNTIKGLVTRTLGSTVTEAAHTAAQVIAKIGAIELAAHQWPELVPTLLSTVSKTTLECLGYLCEELPQDIVSQDQTNSILFAIMKGMGADQADDLRKVACTALLNTLDFARKNMGVPAECKLIMSNIITCTKCTAMRVRLVAFECLVRVAELYYEVLGPFIGECYGRTFEAVQASAEEDVARQALEFWNTLAEQEFQIQQQIAIDVSSGEEPSVVNNEYCGKALGNLVKLLFAQMCKQEEHQEEGDWNIAMASGTCLSTLALTCGKTILGHVMPFVTANIASPDWHKREAATLAFGSCMQGPDSATLLPKILEALPFLLGKITAGTADAMVPVRDTTAWTLGRAVAYHFPHLREHVDKFVLTFAAALEKDEPRVAANCCYGIHNIAEHMATYPSNTNPLSKHFALLVQKLIGCAGRSDFDEHNLRNSAYEALNVLIQHAGDDTVGLIMRLVPSVLGYLEMSLNKPIETADDKEEQYGLQVNLCALLQAIMLRVGAGIKPHKAKVFELLMKVFNTKFATAHEEAYMAMGSLASALEAEFGDYMKVFFPRLCVGLGSIQEYQVCYVAVSIIGDLCRALEGGMLPYTPTMVDGLLANLKNPLLNKSVKPGILAAFGDLALAVGAGFPTAKVNEVMRMLVDASKATVPDDDEDLVEFLGDLRLGVLEGMTSVVQGFNDEADMTKLPMLTGFLPEIAQFLKTLSEDPELDEKLVFNATSLIGDLCHTFGAAVTPHIAGHMPWVINLVTYCQENGDEDSLDMAKWTGEMLGGGHA